jgi:hypothetical protein
VGTSDDTKRPGRFARYLGSTKNIAGSALGAGGLALFFAGVIGPPLWPFVVAALYGIGALAAPPGRPKDLLGGTFDPDQVRESLAKLQKEIRGRVPDDIAAKVQRISAAVESILPKAGRLSGGSQHLFVLQRTATDYLPTTVHSYLDLPRQYADTRPIEDGKTAHQVVAEQLDLLASQMDEVVDAANKGDVDRLLSQGRFLDERFGQRGLSIEGPAPGDGKPAGGGTPPSDAPPKAPPPLTQL